MTYLGMPEEVQHSPREGGPHQATAILQPVRKYRHDVLQRADVELLWGLKGQTPHAIAHFPQRLVPSKEMNIATEHRAGTCKESYLPHYHCTANASIDCY